MIENFNYSIVKFMRPSNPLFIPLDVYTAGSLDFISLDVYGYSVTKISQNGWLKNNIKNLKAIRKIFPNSFR